jgi:hypothetical protein
MKAQGVEIKELYDRVEKYLRTQDCLYKDYIRLEVRSKEKQEKLAEDVRREENLK